MRSNWGCKGGALLITGCDSSVLKRAKGRSKPGALCAPFVQNAQCAFCTSGGSPWDYRAFMICNPRSLSSSRYPTVQKVGYTFVPILGYFTTRSSMI